MEIVLVVLLLFGGFALGSATAEKETMVLNHPAIVHLVSKLRQIQFPLHRGCVGVCLTSPECTGI